MPQSTPATRDSAKRSTRRITAKNTVKIGTRVTLIDKTPAGTWRAAA